MRKNRMSKTTPIITTVPSIILMAATLAACDEKPQIPSDFTTVAACERYYGQGNCDVEQGATHPPVQNHQAQNTPQTPPQPAPQSGGGGGGGGGGINSFIMIPGFGGNTYAPAPVSGFTDNTPRTYGPRPGTAPLPAYRGATVAPRGSTVGGSTIGSTSAPRSAIGSTGTVARGGMGATASAGASGG